MTPTCYLTKNPSGKKYNLTQASSSFTWGGSTDSVARTLDIDYLNGPYDPVAKKLVNPACGDYVSFKYDKKELFYGRVYSIEKKSENGTVTIHCIDNSQYLLKNTANKVFKNTTAEGITKKLCGEYGLSTGTIASTGISISRMICKEDTIIDMIMKAYTKAYRQNGKKYQAIVSGRKFNIVEKGKLVSGFELSESKNITGSSYNMSTEELVDKVVAYDDKGKKKGVYTDAARQKKYGTFQAIYNKENGTPLTAGAKALLTGPTQSLSIDAIGDARCISGYAVTVKDSSTGVKGKYWIKTDSHKFENGVYTMSLELEFKNIMETVADDDSEKQDKKDARKAASEKKKAERKARASAKKKKRTSKKKTKKKKSVIPGLPGV